MLDVWSVPAGELSRFFIFLQECVMSPLLKKGIESERQFEEAERTAQAMMQTLAGREWVEYQLLATYIGEAGFRVAAVGDRLVQAGLLAFKRKPGTVLFQLA
jgi:hypothetical protein